MNSITGIENLIQQPRILDTPYWIAYTDKETEGNKIREFTKDDATLDESEKALRQLIDMYSDSGANLVFKFLTKSKTDNINKHKGFCVIRFYMPGRNGMQPQASGIGAISPDEISKMVDDKVATKIREWETQKKIDELIAKNKELEQAIKDAEPSAFERVIGRFEPFVEPLIGYILPNMKVQQAAAAAVGEATNDEQERMEKALTIIVDGEQNPVELFEKLAKLKKENPMKYNMAKTML